MSGCTAARNRGIETVICATTNTAGFRQQTLPAVGLFDVIEHVEEETAFLNSIKSLIKPEGYLYATVPAYSFLWSDEDIAAGHFRRYNLAGISRALESAGFQVEFASYIFRWLPVPVFLMRTLPYRLGLAKNKNNTEAVSRDHAVGGGGGRQVLDWLLRPEIENLAQQRPMKFGGSCLIVAKRL